MESACGFECPHLCWSDLGTLLLQKITYLDERLSFGLASNRQTLVGFAVIFGLGFGGVFTITKVMVSECFGTKELGRILGVYSMFNAFAGSAGIAVTASIQTQHHSYLRAFQLVCFVALLALLNFWFVKPAVQAPTTSAAE
jgi:MFS family permease